GALVGAVGVLCVVELDGGEGAVVVEAELIAHDPIIGARAPGGERSRLRAGEAHAGQCGRTSGGIAPQVPAGAGGAGRGHEGPPFRRSPCGGSSREPGPGDGEPTEARRARTLGANSW